MIPGGGNSMLLSAGGTGYQIQRSLRFRASATAYLNRTPAGAGSAQKFTYSLWVKRGSNASDQTLISAGTGGNRVQLIFDSTGYLRQDDSGTTRWQTNAIHRDSGAWYHIVWAVDTTQATGSNRNRIYVNGVELTSFSTYNTHGINFNFPDINAAVLHRIGVTSDATNRPLDGYLAEVNWVNNQQLTPSSFGQIDTAAGQWSPKKYTGTYGTNGFYLDFSDNTSTTNLCLDRSGNGNNWTPNNISLAAGSTYDSMTDVPLTYGTTDRGNYCTLNPLDQSGANTLTNANLRATVVAGSPTLSASFAISSGKWYWEVLPETITVNAMLLGIANAAVVASQRLGSSSNGYYYISDGTKYTNSSATAYGASYTTTDVIGFALDMDAKTITCYKNNVSQGVMFSSLPDSVIPCFSNGTGTGGQVFSINFGQRPFAYTPPAGFKALHTGNLPDPAILKPNLQFDVVTYVGDGATTKTISGVGFQAGLTWLKRRSAAASHVLQDAVRGFVGTAKLASNATSAENSSGGATDSVEGFVSAVSGTGFTVTKGTGQQVNENSASYAAWLWKAGGAAVTNTDGSISAQVSANPSAGFSVVTYTGNGVDGATIGHGLGVALGFSIIRRLNGVMDWNVKHKGMTSNNVAHLNLTAAQGTPGSGYQGDLGSSSVVTLKSGGAITNVNASGGTYVAYCFAEVAGYSKIGSYVGNGSSDGPFVFCGFRPRWILRKAITSAYRWVVIDTARSDFNVADDALYPNFSNAEETSTTNWGIDITGTGFKVRSTDVEANGNGTTFIYIAFAEVPFKFTLAR